MTLTEARAAELRDCYAALYPKAKPPTESGLRCYDLLCMWLRGPHHLRCNRLDLSGHHCVEYVGKHALASFDFDDLTRLVFLAHDLAIRVEVTARAPGLLRILLHPRQRGGGFWQHHPTLEDAVAAWREGIRGG